MNYYIINKRNLWTVQRKSDRKQMAPGFQLKSDANAFIEKLLAKENEQTLPVSQFKFKTEWLNYANARLMDASDPSMRITIQGVSGYLTDYNQRISKFMPVSYTHLTLPTKA